MSLASVIDKTTGEHLSFVTVALKGTVLNTVTDKTGHYFLKNLPEGEFTLEVSMLGYETESRRVTLKKGETLEENFEIDKSASQLDGVVVSGRTATKRNAAWHPRSSRCSIQKSLKTPARKTFRKV